MRLVRGILTGLIIILTLGGNVIAEQALSPQICSEIESGRRRALVEQLQKEVSLHPERSMAFYRLGLLAVRRSGDYLRDAGRLQDDKSNEERLVAMARYYLAAGEPMQAVVHAARHAESFPRGQYTDEAQYVLGLAETALGRYDDAERRFDWLSRNARQPWRGWALYAQGEAALRTADTTEALRLFKSASGMRDHAATAPSLLMLGNIYDARGQISDAFRYLSMYREAYPGGILPLLEHAVPTTDRAEAAAGLVYTIQVGVFGDRENVERQRNRFKSLDYPVTLKAKTVAGNQYTAVWVGKFNSRDVALRARERLEARFDETYRVVVLE